MQQGPSLGTVYHSIQHASFLNFWSEAWVFGQNQSNIFFSICWLKYSQFSGSVLSDLCKPMDCSTPHLPVHHQFLELAQTHVHRVSDAIQPSRPLLSPFPLAFILSQHQGLLWWAGSLHQVGKVFEFQFQHQSFQRTCTVDFLQNWLVWSPCSPRDSCLEYSPTPHFKSINSSVLSLLYGPTLTSIHEHWKKP